MVSPIKSNEDSVGVVILLGEELASDPRVLALHREIHEPLDEITRCLIELSEATGGLRSSRYRQALDDGVRALDAVRKHAEEIQKILAELRERQIAILITDHAVAETLRISDRAYILDKGKVIAEGAPQDIIRNEQVRQVYLGHSFGEGLTEEEEKSLDELE